MITLKKWAADNSVSYMTAWRAVHDGQIPGAAKVRGQWRVPADAHATVNLATADSDYAPVSLTINGVLYLRADVVQTEDAEGR